MIGVTIPLIAHYAQGMAIFDMMTSGYSYDYALKLLDTLGEAGRNTYLFPQLTLDLAFPLTYVPAFVLLIASLLKPSDCLYNKPVFYTCFVPVFVGLADYGENISVGAMLYSYPDISYALYQFSSTCTVLKGIGLALTFALLLIYFLIFIFYKIKKIKQ